MRQVSSLPHRSPAPDFDPSRSKSRTRPPSPLVSAARKVLGKLVGNIAVRDVPVADLRCAEKKYFVEEGYGCRGIEEWPPYGFFRTALQGDRERASGEFSLWYKIQLFKYYNKPKRDGGMLKGSLYRSIESACRACGAPFDGNIRNVDEQVVMEAIWLRVASRLALLDSIVSFGFISTPRAPVKGIARNGLVYLRNGHHRTAIMGLLGDPAVPQVRVFSSGKALKNYNRFCRCLEALPGPRGVPALRGDGRGLP